MIVVDYNDELRNHVNDKYYQNRSRFYLLPSVMLLRSGMKMTELAQHINAVGTSYEGNIYLYVDIVKPMLIKAVIDTLKYHDELVVDYLINQRTHVIVVRPDINYNAFLEGNYTKIYTKGQIQTCFPKDNIIRDIILHRANMIPKYKDYIRKEFGPGIKDENINLNQYDIPPAIKQEIYDN